MLTRECENRASIRLLERIAHEFDRDLIPSLSN
jgi:hypothetical protein